MAALDAAMSPHAQCEIRRGFIGAARCFSAKKAIPT
jgi:hypothetical protein